MSTVIVTTYEMFCYSPISSRETEPDDNSAILGHALSLVINPLGLIVSGSLQHFLDTDI